MGNSFIGDLLKEHGKIYVVYVRDGAFFDFIKRFCKDKSVEYVILGDKILMNQKTHEETEIKEEKNKTDAADRMRPYLEKYLLSKTNEFKGIIAGIYQDKDLFSLIGRDTLENLEQHFVTLYGQVKEHSSSTSEDYDQIMSTESTCNTAYEFIQDMKKMRKLLETKGIKVDYFRILEELAKLIGVQWKQALEKLTVPLYKRISKITKDKKQIIKECLKLGIDDPIEDVVADLFNRFKLVYTQQELRALIHECKREKEIEDFEKSLGIPGHRKMEDFEELSGHQFEDYLKELFTSLGYQVVRTKLSGDQGADLIIKRDDKKTVVQAKKYSGPVSNKAIQEVVASQKHYKADSAMVVTTGKFTKSALELAKSNTVDLWDGEKLKKIVDEINSKSSEIVESSYYEKKVNLEEESFTATCQFCKSEINIPFENLPEKNKTSEIKCTECDFGKFKIQIPEKAYECAGCKKSFNIIPDKVKHTKACHALKERSFSCKKCMTKFTLDDDEFKQLKQKKTISVACPKCQKKTTIQHSRL